MMNKSMGLLIVALALLVDAADVCLGLSLKEICNGDGRSSTGEALATVDAIKPIIELVKADNGGQSTTCSEFTKQSILDLEPIITSETICTQEVATKIGQYYEKYLNIAGAASRKPKLPEPIKKYFLSIGALVSGECKQFYALAIQEMMGWRNVLRDDMAFVLDVSMGAKHLADSILGQQQQPSAEQSKPEFQSLALVTDMFGSLGGRTNLLTAFGSKRVHLELELKRIFDEVTNKCLNKFKPIYDELMIPLAILSNVGFDHDLSGIDQLEGYNLRPLFESDFLGEWLETVYVCEITLRANVEVDPRTVHGPSDGGMESVDKLTPDELAKLEERVGFILDEPEPADDHGQQQQQQHMTVRLNGSADLISDGPIQRAVENFEGKREEAELLRHEQMKRFVEAAREISF